MTLIVYTPYTNNPQSFFRSQNRERLLQSFSVNDIRFLAVCLWAKQERIVPLQFPGLIEQEILKNLEAADGLSSPSLEMFPDKICVYVIITSNPLFKRLRELKKTK